jgi:citronellol/citronellal dehydrogenase
LSSSRDCPGQSLLADTGVSDFSIYLNGGREEDLTLDFWVEPKSPHDPAKRLH